MKKLLLGLGTITAIAVPVVAVVACSVPTTDDWNKNPSTKMFGITDYGKKVFWTFTNTDGLETDNLMEDRDGCIGKVEYGYWHLEHEMFPYTKHVNTEKEIKWD